MSFTTFAGQTNPEAVQFREQHPDIIDFGKATELALIKAGYWNDGIDEQATVETSVAAGWMLARNVLVENPIRRILATQIQDVGNDPFTPIEGIEEPSLRYYSLSSRLVSPKTYSHITELTGFVSDFSGEARVGMNMNRYGTECEPTGNGHIHHDGVVNNPTALVGIGEGHIRVSTDTYQRAEIDRETGLIAGSYEDVHYGEHDVLVVDGRYRYHQGIGTASEAANIRHTMGVFSA